MSAFPPVPVLGHIKQMRGADAAYVCVLVEGDDDSRFWQRWLKYQPLTRGGCEGVVQACGELRAAGLSGFVGLIDRDYCNHHHAGADLLVTEFRDRECDLLQSNGLDSFRAAFGLLNLAPEIRSRILNAIEPFSVARLVYFWKREAFPEDFHPANSRIFDPSNLSTSEDEFSKRWSELSGGDEAEFKELADSALKMVRTSPWLFANGHDALKVLHLISHTDSEFHKKQCKNFHATAWQFELAFDKTDLDSVRLWSELAQWERRSRFSVRK